ncbi:ATP-binding protein [Clostridium perfringens]|uniref:ATP-binding protein n=1 Tax=Clostridium perfringens TaxID=1502 RepID=UPI00224608C9|nr:ATP-binding protein [Clostridium perfringens]MCX0411774.1 ATP-binding protein [Clostridium perfringens]
MEALDRILAKVKEQSQSMTMTKSMESKYKCPKCKDTGIILEYREGLQPLGKQCSCRLSNNIERAWREFGVEPSKVKKVNEFIPFDKVTENAKNKVIDYIFNFNKTKEHGWFIFMGQPGAGKSHLAIALGAALFKDKKRHVIYMPYTEAIMGLKGNAKDFEQYTTLLDRYKEAEILVIDDLFKDKVRNGQVIAPLNDIDMKHIYPLLNYRYYKKLITIISTECTIEMLEQLDRALAGRIIERAGNNMVIFMGEEYDYRFKKLR